MDCYLINHEWNWLRKKKDKKKDKNKSKINQAVKEFDWYLLGKTIADGLNGITEASGVDSVGNNSYLTNATRVLTTPDEQSVTQTHGNIVETYNADGDKKDLVHAEGWEKTDNTNTHTGTVGDVARTVDDNKRNENGTDSYVNHEYGKIGVQTYQEMQMKWRETFLNIDMQIIDELGDLFMKVW